MRTLSLYSSMALLLLIGFASCKKDPEPQPNNNSSTTDPNATLKQQIKENYCAIAFAVYEDCYNKALLLQTKINALIAAPSSTTLDDARQAWKDAREPYGQSEVFRFSDGPVDDGDGPEGFINAWPMDESFVDYVTGNPTAGIINNISAYPTITNALLLSLNESGSETNIAVGFHAIEFLLWGQDLSTTSAGTRSYLDFVTAGGTASNETRRAQYLQICAQQLVDFLAYLKGEWDPAVSGNYRETFLSLSHSSALQKMFNQMAVLSHNELAGERIYVAYDNMNQEDEHSCFSDNTHRDIILNAKGIQNIYKGEYTRTDGSTVSGSSLEDLIQVLSPTKNTEMLTLLSESDIKVNSIYIPFDQAIVLPAERPKVLEAVTKLQEQGLKLVEIADELFNITINL